MNRIFMSALIIVFMVGLYYQRDFFFNKAPSYVLHTQFHQAQMQDDRISIKTSAIEKGLSVSVQKDILLSEDEVQSINLQDEKIVPYKTLPFPIGHFIAKRILDEDSYAEIFRTKEGDEITNLYFNKNLSSEKWTSPTGRSIIRSYEDNRLFAITEEVIGKSTTIFFDSGSITAKRVDMVSKESMCIKYDSNGMPYAKGLKECQDDDFREFDDIGHYDQLAP